MQLNIFVTVIAAFQMGVLSQSAATLSLMQFFDNVYRGQQQMVTQLGGTLPLMLKSQMELPTPGFSLVYLAYCRSLEVIWQREHLCLSVFKETCKRKKTTSFIDLEKSTMWFYHTFLFCVLRAYKNYSRNQNYT